MAMHARGLLSCGPYPVFTGENRDRGRLHRVGGENPNAGRTPSDLLDHALRVLYSHTVFPYGDLEPC
jgi:hypothetical protein